MATNPWAEEANRRWQKDQAILEHLYEGKKTARLLRDGEKGNGRTARG